MRYETLIEHPYQTPQGFTDHPFIYVFDGSGLTDGVDALNLAVQIQEDAFILRRVAGVPLCAASWMLKSDVNANCFASNIHAMNNWVVAPEKLYPANSAIKFDLITVLRSFVACATNIFDSQIAFQGVKRISNKKLRTPVGIARYYDKPFSYTFALSLNWFRFLVAATGNADAPHTFALAIDDYDFELHRILVCKSDGSQNTVPAFQMSLLDPFGYAMMSAPVNQFLLAEYQTGATFHNFQSVFPAPTMLYPVGSQIKFEITSLLCNAGGAMNLNIEFQGVRRIPC